jgi:hypothetical protein
VRFPMSTVQSTLDGPPWGGLLCKKTSVMLSNCQVGAAIRVETGQ